MAYIPVLSNGKNKGKGMGKSMMPKVMGTGKSVNMGGIANVASSLKGVKLGGAKKLR